MYINIRLRGSSNNNRQKMGLWKKIHKNLRQNSFLCNVRRYSLSIYSRSLDHKRKIPVSQDNCNIFYAYKRGNFIGY